MIADEKAVSLINKQSARIAALEATLGDIHAIAARQLAEPGTDTRALSDIATKAEEVLRGK